MEIRTSPFDPSHVLTLTVAELAALGVDFKSSIEGAEDLTLAHVAEVGKQTGPFDPNDVHLLLLNGLTSLAAELNALDLDEPSATTTSVAARIVTTIAMAEALKLPKHLILTALTADFLPSE